MTIEELKEITERYFGKEYYKAEGISRNGIRILLNIGMNYETCTLVFKYRDEMTVNYGITNCNASSLDTIIKSALKHPIKMFKRIILNNCIKFEDNKPISLISDKFSKLDIFSDALYKSGRLYFKIKANKGGVKHSKDIGFATIIDNTILIKHQTKNLYLLSTLRDDTKFEEFTHYNEEFIEKWAELLKTR
jgi:hypothetical protein